MKRRTKIVCTLGPAVDSKEKIKQLIDAGMNVARLNCSHGDWEAKQRWIGWIRELSPIHSPIAILADLQGPKFRVGELPGGAIELVTGQSISVGLNKEVPINQSEILAAMEPGGRLLLGDGEIEIKITSGEKGEFVGKVVTGGTLKSKKGVTLVGKVFDVPALTSKDIDDAVQAKLAGCDFIALSYVKSALDIRELRRFLDHIDAEMRICAKIETREAIKDLDDILKMVDIIMVARGDMGLQMEIESVPAAQKAIIEKCSLSGKPVITATQMLESMVNNPRPTRAEASDVFNAILDGTDAVMLSGETAAGSYPIECVKTMAKIAEAAEEVIASHPDYVVPPKVDPTVDAVVNAVGSLEREMKPKAIVCASSSGQTPRLISKYRPKAPILCASWQKQTLAYMAVVWGVDTVYIEGVSDMENNLDRSVEAFMKLKKLRIGDRYIYTAGFPAGTPGSTNLILTQTLK